MESLLHVGHRMTFPRHEGWVTAHNLRRLGVRCGLLSLLLGLLFGLSDGSLQAAAAGALLGLGWCGPTALELFDEAGRAHRSLRATVVAGLSALLTVPLALLQGVWATHNLSGKPGWFPSLSGPQLGLALTATLIAAALMALAHYYRLRAIVGNPLPDLLGLAAALAALAYVPLALASLVSGSALGVLSALIYCLLLALTAAVACLPLVAIAYWSDWLCARYFQEPA